jgi:hypothetical protein
VAYYTGATGTNSITVDGSPPIFVFGSNPANPSLTHDSLQIQGGLKAGGTTTGTTITFHDGPTGYTFPNADGNPNEILTTDGSGQLSFTTTGAGSMSSWTLSGDSGAGQTINDADTVDIAGGSGISTAASATDTVTITNDLPFNDLTLAADTGPSQTITDGDTITVAGGTALSSVASATDTVTLNLDNTTVTAGTYSLSTITVDAQGRLTSASSGNVVQYGSAVFDFYLNHKTTTGGIAEYLSTYPNTLKEGTAWVMPWGGQIKWITATSNNSATNIDFVEIYDVATAGVKTAWTFTGTGYAQPLPPSNNFPTFTDYNQAAIETTKTLVFNSGDEIRVGYQQSNSDDTQISVSIGVVWTNNTSTISNWIVDVPYTG